MPPKKGKREPGIEILLVSLFILFIIGAIIVMYILRVALFGPNDTSLYGKYSEPEIGRCNVEGKNINSVRCTDTGTQVSIRRCLPNSVTGLACWDGSAQTMASLITISPCTPLCTAFDFVQTDVSPCLIETFSTITPFNLTAYDSLDVQWCRDIRSGTRFRTYNCERRDGSGSNLCAFNCGNSNVYNADCLTSFPDFKNNNAGTTILYDPTLLPANNTADFEIQNNTYFYHPDPKSAYGGFPVLASNVMVTKESCDDFHGVICGNWEKSTIVGGLPVIDTTKDNNFTLAENCNVEAKIRTATGIGYFDGNLPYNYNTSTNDIYDLFKPGIQERELTCFAYDSTSAARCNPEALGCIKSADIFSGGASNNILKLLGVSSVEQAQICGIPIKDEQNITIGVEKNTSILKPCIFTKTNFSLNPNTNSPNTIVRPLIKESYWLFDGVNNIFGIPLFMTKKIGTKNLYLSLFNTPCPEYNLEVFGLANFFTFTNAGSFTSTPIDPIPVKGIPFSFDCKGNTSGVIETTPCSWVEDVKIDPAGIFGVEQDCNIRAGGMSPIIEQTALMLMVKPAEYSFTEIPPPPNVIKCNIFGIFGGNYIGWLTAQNNVPGYPDGDSSGYTLTWTQGRFDSYGNSLIVPGERIESLPQANFYITKPTPTTFYLGTALQSVNVFDGFNSTIAPLGEFTFKKATSGGLPLVDTINGNNFINDTTFSNFLYSRQNDGHDDRFPSCNIMISRH